MASETRQCSRCGRVDDYSDMEEWIEEDNGSWAGPECFTAEERALVAVFEETVAAEMMNQCCGRCGKDVEAAEAEELEDWLLDGDGEWICKGCRTHIEIIADAVIMIEKLGTDDRG